MVIIDIKGEEGSSQGLSIPTAWAERRNGGEEYYVNELRAERQQALASFHRDVVTFQGIEERYEANHETNSERCVSNLLKDDQVVSPVLLRVVPESACKISRQDKTTSRGVVALSILHNP